MGIALLLGSALAVVEVGVKTLAGLLKKILINGESIFLRITVKVFRAIGTPIFLTRGKPTFLAKGIPTFSAITGPTLLLICGPNSLISRGITLCIR
ncbi:MAG: hypothetical protein ACOX7U_06430 [Desulfitobacteriia bacterium]